METPREFRQTREEDQELKPEALNVKRPKDEKQPAKYAKSNQ